MLTDFEVNKLLIQRISRGIGLLLASLLVVACALQAPVQEMSNARQTIQAAKAARADELAPALYKEATSRLESATLELEAGEYERARSLALEAKQLALKARQLAVGQKE